MAEEDVGELMAESLAVYVVLLGAVTAGARGMHAVEMAEWGGLEEMPLT